MKMNSSDWRIAERALRVVGIGAATIIGIGLLAVLVNESAKTSSDSKTEHSVDGPTITSVAVPCAVDRTAEATVLRAIHNGDEAALDGIVERKKAFLLLKGTEFEVSENRDGITWGFVRSGRYSGEDCYIPAAFLQQREAEK